MGLFDGYNFDPSTYQSDGGSLIDRLLAQLGTQGQYQPAPGFPQSPMDANASIDNAKTYAANVQPQQQNAPIAVGDYMMPRIGSGFPGYPQHDPQTGETMPAQSAPAPPASPLFAQPQPQNSPGGLGSAFRGALANMQGGPLGMIGGAFAGGLGMGQGTPEEQKLRDQQRTMQQTYSALIAAGVPESKARLAAINTEYGKKIVDTELGSDKFAFTTLPDGTVVRQNARTGEVAPAYQGGTKPTFGIVGEDDGKKVYGWQDPTKRTIAPYQVPGTSDVRGTVTGPDGKLIAIPPGVDRKTFVNEISKTNADAATGKMTEVQAKASSYAARMELAERNLKTLDTRGGDFWNRLTETTPVIGGTSATNWMQGDNYQKYRQARDNFISGVLRQESGAAIAPSEFTRTEKEYFPQPGDSAGTIKQKATARATVIEQMKRAAGPGYKSPASNAANETADPLGIR